MGGGSTLLTTLRRRRRAASGIAPAGIDQTGLIAAWDLSEQSGARVDQKGGLDLTDNNTVTGQAAGSPQGGPCSQFTAANSEFLSHASAAALQTGDIDFTVEAWVYMDTIGANRRFVARDDEGANREYVLWYFHGGTCFAFQMGGSTLLGTGAAPAAGGWHYLVGWHDATADTMNLQVDNGAPDSQAEAVISAKNVPLTVGVDSAPFNYHNGRMWALRFWKRVLTSDERVLTWNGGLGRTFAQL